MEYILAALIMGIFATATIDVWAEILGRGFKLPTTNWAMVGRWFGHLPKGRFIHKPISASPEIANELTVGWVLHYLIGIVYAFMYLSLVESNPELMTALAFGVVTVLVPWFVLQPGLGFGCVARLAPKPRMVRMINLSMHSIFGVALYAGWLLSELVI